VNREHKLAALLHDASEAYLVDIPRPIKLKLTEYHPIENNLMRVIAEKYGFHYPLHNAVKQADEKMLQQEWDVFCIGSSKQWPSAKETRHVKSWFLTEFNLYAGINDKAGDRKAA
jgi:5'-deoxynucleotidase YfbR-like HD superfamily hydrolase